MIPRHSLVARALLALLATVPSLARAQQGASSPDPVVCDLSAYRPVGSMVATNAADGTLALEWIGTGTERVRLRTAVVGGVPTILELAVRAGGGSWIPVATDSRLEFDVVEGLRRISNQQLQPMRALNMPLTDSVIDKYKWDVFWDAPLDLSPTSRAGNPPPPDGVASQPGLPRKPEEIRRGTVAYAARSCAVVTEGARIAITWPGLTMGSFSGDLVLTAFDGTNLIKAEVVASTALPSVAYKYDAGITGLDLGRRSRVTWRDISHKPQSYALAGPANQNEVPLKAANRIVVAETGGASIAAFPPPHTFFWAREVEINVGNNWYRKDGDRSFSIGIRQGEGEVVEQYRANWSLYSAPPGSKQRMALYLFPTAGPQDYALAGALSFTNGDVYRALPGYQVMGSHYHTDMARDLQATGSVDSRLTDFEVLRAAGINIAGPVDRPNTDQLEELWWLFEGAKRHSDDQFMVLPELENTNLLGGHWDLFFSHPVFYVDERAAGTPLVTQHEKYGKVYNIGTAEDMWTMIETEKMLVSMPHPRTKGSTGYPDAVKDSPQFNADRYRGVGWRWGMGSDLSEIRLSDYRVLPLLDDMNNWIAKTSLRPKYLIAITETYAKQPGDDVYANGPVSYLKLPALPEPGNYAPIVDVLMSGDFFVTSGEVLIPSHRYEGTGGNMAIVADVQWTFPLDFVEVVYGDGKKTERTIVSAKDLPAHMSKQFRIPFNAAGMSWVRFAAWDTAGNGALTQPVRIGTPE